MHALKPLPPIQFMKTVQLLLVFSAAGPALLFLLSMTSHCKQALSQETSLDLKLSRLAGTAVILLENLIRQHAKMPVALQSMQASVLCYAVLCCAVLGLGASRI